MLKLNVLCLLTTDNTTTCLTDSWGNRKVTDGHQFIWYRAFAVAQHTINDYLHVVLVLNIIIMITMEIVYNLHIHSNNLIKKTQMKQGWLH